MSQASYQKRMREKARADKAEAKRQRREDRSVAVDETEQDSDTVSTAPERDVLAELAQLHKQFDDDAIDFEDFEQRKAQLIAQLNV